MAADSRPSHSERQIVAVPPWNDADPYTMAARLCGDDGIVRGGAMHHGTDYPCTGHAHYAGEHIRCLSAGHPEGIPADLDALLRNPAIDLGAGLVPPPRTAAGLRARRLMAEIEGRDVR